MRVAVLTHAAPAGDAIGRQIAEKAAFLSERGAAVTVFAETLQQLHPDLVGLTRRFAPPRPTGPLWHELSSADLVLVEYSQYFPLLDLIPLLRQAGTRILFDYHGVTPPEWGLPGQRDALERGCRQRGLAGFADLVLVHSRFARGELTAQDPTLDSRIREIDYPIEPSSGMETPPRSLRARLGLSAECRLLLHVGRLAPNKRVPVLIEALARLREQTPEVHAVVIGHAEREFAGELARCRDRAERRGIAARVHYLGHVNEAELQQAYRECDLLVLPSVHEGFCWPVMEAFAHGLPVIAARATALPQTVGDAGLTFQADDPADLARVAQRLLTPPAVELPETDHPRRIAVVTPCWGEAAGGAERSLTRLAQGMAQAGHAVEIFTLDAANSPPGDAALKVHHYPADPRDPLRQAAAANAMRLGTADAEAFDEFLDHSPRSRALVRALAERGPFDAIVVGPYLLGLTRDVAQAFAGRVVLMPCWHDEPAAHRPEWLSVVGSVGGVLYHSPEEKRFAEADRGLNHPNSAVLGAIIDRTPGRADRGRARLRDSRRMILYCGRLCAEKGLPELIDFARRYAAKYPDRFVFAFLGQGDFPLPEEPWCRNLGSLADEERRNVLAEAAALVQLSRFESLSLVVLEAFAQGVPVIVRSGNEVLEGHLQRSGGGRAVGCADEFAACLDELWARPETWAARGEAGKQYVETSFADPDRHAAAWRRVLAGLDRPILDLLRENGRTRRAACQRDVWRAEFARVVDSVLHQAPSPATSALRIEAPSSEVRAAPVKTVLVPVRLVNRGSLPEAAEGPGRSEIVSWLVDAAGQKVGDIGITPLAAILPAGGRQTLLIRVAAPAETGAYDLMLACRRHADPDPFRQAGLACCRIALQVATKAEEIGDPGLEGRLQGPLARAWDARQLPDGYVDVSVGWLGRAKLWLKNKLLHNFQHAYVNVLARQQTAFNQAVLQALAECAEAQSALARDLERLPAEHPESRILARQVRTLRRANRRLKQRLARLERARSTDRPCAQEETPA